MNSVLENILKRRSIRVYKTQPVEQEKIKDIITAALHAPSGKNRQSFQFTVVQSQENMQELFRVMANALGRTDYQGYGAPVLILASDQRDNTNGLADCSCALQNMFLTAASLDLGSVWLNQLKLICDVKEVRAVLMKLEIPDDHIVWGIAAIGYADEEPVPKERTGTVKYC